MKISIIFFLAVGLISCSVRDNSRKELSAKILADQTMQKVDDMEFWQNLTPCLLHGLKKINNTFEYFLQPFYLPLPDGFCPCFPKSTSIRFQQPAKGYKLGLNQKI